MKKFNQFREDSLLEVLKASDPTGKWIDDFVHSDNPKFAGKSKKERIRMALGASYASKRNEEVDLEEASPMIKPPSNRFDNKKEAFTHAKTHGGKVFRSTYIDPNTGNKNITFVVKKDQNVAEGSVNDYFKRRKDEEDRIAGTKAPAKRTPKQTDYEKKRKEQGVAEGSTQKDMTGQTCEKCKKDKYQERSQHDDMEGKVTCSCGNRVNRWKNYKEKGVAEAKDEGEYDYEGAMAKTQLQTICRNAADLRDMLEDDENLPEWVQAKITKAEDYITTSLDYMKSSEELGEEVEELDELSKSTLADYAKKAARSATTKRKIAADFENKGTRAKSPGMKRANAKLSQDYKEKSWKRQDNVNKAIDRLAKEDTEVAEARMSAAQRLWNAEKKQRAKSDASLARTPSSIPKPEEKK